MTSAAQEADRVYEVLFDREFMGGLSARASGPRIYRLPLMAMINLSHGMRKEPAAYQVIRPTAIVHPVNNANNNNSNHLVSDLATKERTPESFANAVSGGGARSKKKAHQSDDSRNGNQPAASATTNVANDDTLPGSYPKSKDNQSRNKKDASIIPEANQQQQHSQQQFKKDAPQRQQQQQQQQQKQQPKTVSELGDHSF